MKTKKNKGGKTKPALLCFLLAAWRKKRSGQQNIHSHVLHIMHMHCIRCMGKNQVILLLGFHTLGHVCFDCCCAFKQSQNCLEKNSACLEKVASFLCSKFGASMLWFWREMWTLDGKYRKQLSAVPQYGFKAVKANSHLANRPTFLEDKKLWPRRLDRRQPEVSRRALHSEGDPHDY